MRSPIYAAAAALVISAVALPGLVAAQAPGNPPSPSQQKPPEIPPAEQQAKQKDALPVIKPPAQMDKDMVKPAPDAGPNATPVVKPPPGNGDPVVPK